MTTTPTITRIYHPWWKWECYKAGFFKKESNKERQSAHQKAYVELLSDLDKFAYAMRCVINYWPYSCEHNLTNESMNRIAWLGQASACYTFGACAEQTRGAFHHLSQKQQDEANALADLYLKFWTTRHLTPMPRDLLLCPTSNATPT